jgi:DNA-directed RNA polymerase specialized sigma subunit
MSYTVDELLKKTKFKERKNLSYKEFAVDPTVLDGIQPERDLWSLSEHHVRKLRILAKVIEKSLTRKQKRYINMYYYESLSYRAIGKQMHISNEGARKIIQRSIEIIAKSIKEEI